MKRITTFLFLILFAFALQGQRVLTYGGKVLTYEGKVLIQDYVPESETIFAAMGTAPNTARKRLIDNLVRGLKADGIWSMLDFLYLLAAHAENSSLLNWINPGTFDATNVHSTAYEIDRGYTGDGANDYLTSYNPFTDGINYTQNSASIGLYCITNVDAVQYDMGSISATTRVAILLRNGNEIPVWINDDTILEPANTDSRGFFILSRTDANAKAIYRNKGVLGSDASASVGMPDFEIYILCRNNQGSPLNFSTKQIAASFAGGGMTQTNVNNFTDRIEIFMDAIGAGIID